MDFNDSPDEAAFRAEARAFLDEHAPREPIPQYHKEKIEDDVILPRHREWQRTLHAHGWGALTWSKEYGGRGLGPIEQIIWNHELGRVQRPLSHREVGRSATCWAALNLF